jgi:CubicO group peptidase (beta-lactamase class C family)
MEALQLVETWPVDHVSAASVVFAGSAAPSVHTIGDRHRSYRLASIAKPITAWAVLVACEEGIVGLDDPVGQPGCTLRHLLAHAGGYGFDGPDPIAPPGRRRSYSNTGIELAAEAVASAAGMPFEQYLHDAVFDPLGMHASEQRGSPAHAVWSTLDDLVRFALETVHPRLITLDSAIAATTPVFPDLPGVVPGVGRYERNTWGLGFEIRGDKQPHWTGTTNSPRTYGHFGGAGTLMSVDLGVSRLEGVACIALTDRMFDEWAAEALDLWPRLADAVIALHTTSAGGPLG